MLPEVDLSKLLEYILYSSNKGIAFNYTLNASFMGNMEFTRDGIIELKGFLNKLYEAGIRWLTISMPSLIKLVKSSRNQFKVKTIKNSGLCSLARFISGYIQPPPAIFHRPSGTVIRQCLHRRLSCHPP